MTELNQNALPEAAPDVAWPELPCSETDDADAAVEAVLRRAQDIPGLPVSEHPGAYTEMHDALLEALNEDPASASGAA